LQKTTIILRSLLIVATIQYNKHTLQKLTLCLSFTTSQPTPQRTETDSHPSSYTTALCVIRGTTFAPTFTLLDLGSSTPTSESIKLLTSSAGSPKVAISRELGAHHIKQSNTHPQQSNTHPLSPVVKLGVRHPRKKERKKKET